MAITNKDIEKMKEVFETKEEAAGRHNEVITILDKLMKKKETAREDRVFAKAKDDELEKRLEKVEAKVG